MATDLDRQVSPGSKPASPTRTLIEAALAPEDVAKPSLSPLNVNDTFAAHPASGEPHPSCNARPMPPSPHSENPRNPFVRPFYRVVTDGARRPARVDNIRSSETISQHLRNPNEPIHHPVSLLEFALGEISIHTDIGGRRAQEDRFTFAPSLNGRADCAAFGVFDGTVGDFASENVKSFVVPQLLSSVAWAKVEAVLDEQGRRSGENDELLYSSLFPALADSVDHMYLSADSELVTMCAASSQHYASSTSVVAILAGNCCAVGHLGDSRAALGHYGANQIHGNFITDDHKPNQFYERARIRHFGGSVEYLHNHNNKPFIRGGDFTSRKARGEQPMQLQYSRAFGGKDLKTYGLSNEPDIICFRIEPFHCCLILASDGLWDVMSAEMAVKIALQARLAGLDPARSIIQMVLDEQSSRKQLPDNITAMVHFFKSTENERIWADEGNRQALLSQI